MNPWIPEDYTGLTFKYSREISSLACCFQKTGERESFCKMSLKWSIKGWSASPGSVLQSCMPSILESDQLRDNKDVKIEELLMTLYFFYSVRLLILVFRKKISLKTKGALRVVFFSLTRNRYSSLNFITESASFIS